MEKLINKNYSYNYTSFKGANGVWKLVGVEGDGKTEDCIDTFKSTKGEYIERSRKKIKELSDQGKIIPIEESLITIAPYNKKEWDKKVGGRL